MNNLRCLGILHKLRQCQSYNAFRCITQKIGDNLGSAPNHQKNKEESDDEPLQFFGSQAATWRAQRSRSGGAEEHLWYQPLIITGSLAIFLLYFCVFREENDIDLKLSGSLLDHVQGLEEFQLTLTYKYNKENGLDNKEIIQRLSDLGIDVNLLDNKTADGN